MSLWYNTDHKWSVANPEPDVRSSGTVNVEYCTLPLDLTTGSGFAVESGRN